MVTLDDFMRLVAETNHEIEIPDQLDTWGIDTEDFTQFLNMMAANMVGEIIQGETNPAEGIRTTFWCGFELGYRTRLEVEMGS